MSKYGTSTHGFVAFVLDDAFLAGMITFVTSNYSVLVTAIADLTLILVNRNLVRKVVKDRHEQFFMSSMFS